MATTLINTKHAEASKIWRGIRHISKDDINSKARVVSQTYVLSSNPDLINPRLKIETQFEIAKRDLLEIISKPPIFKEILEGAVRKKIDLKKEDDQDEEEEEAEPKPEPTPLPEPEEEGKEKEEEKRVGFDRIVLTIKQPTDLTPPVAPEFTKIVNDAGFIDIDQATIATEGIGAYLPTGFSGEQLTTALNLYAHGVRSSQFENETDKRIPEFPVITGGETKSLYGVSYLVATFEEYDTSQTKQIQNTFSPEIQIRESPAETYTTTEPGQIVFASQDNTFQPIIREAVGVGTDFAKEQVKKFAVNAISKVGKKVAEEAVKKGAGVAVKAGVTAATQAAGTVVPGIGNAVMIVLNKVLPRLIKFVSKLIPKKIREWLSENKKELALASLATLGLGLVFGSPLVVLGGIGLGIIGGSLGGFAGLGTLFFAGLILPFLTFLFGTFLAVILGASLLVVLCYFIISSGAYVVPYNPNAILPGDQQLSQYFRVEKYVDGAKYQKYGNGKREVTYTIYVIPTQGSLSKISFSSKCNVLNGKQNPPPCPNETKIEVNFGPNDDVKFPPEPPKVISPATPYQITYQQTYNSSDFDDSLIIDTFTVTADSGGGNTSTTAGSASLVLGNPPSSCPTIWPITGEDESFAITQGPQGGISHAGQEAIDIAPIDTAFPVLYATHDGVVSQVTYHSKYGNIVRIDGNCKPVGTFRTYYGHLNTVSVSSGSTINAGAEIGIMGRTGSSATGVHVHYMFENNPAIIMDLPYIPIYGIIDRIGLLRCTSSTCNVRIP